MNFTITPAANQPARAAGTQAWVTVQARLDAALDQLAALAESPMTVVEREEVLAGITRATRRVDAIRLRFIAASMRAQVATQSGLTGTDAWVAARTKTDPGKAAREVRLATALHRPGTPSLTGQALDHGDLSAEHAEVITKALASLPAGVTAEDRAAAETRLVTQAHDMTPGTLRRAARRVTEAFETDPAVVDAHHDQLLVDREEQARKKTRFDIWDNNDGTVSGRFTVPTFAGAVLTKVLQSMTAPRRAKLGAVQTRDHAHARGLAFTELLEHLPTDRLHTKTAATVVVTIDHEILQGTLRAAHLDTGDELNASQARRIACTAGILPAILNGKSLPVDLGETQRLFTETQRIAIGLRHDTCAATGCERPFAWCELHHRDPWTPTDPRHPRGPTNLDNGIPLCNFHHQRIHDPSYTHAESPDGIEFLLRR